MFFNLKSLKKRVRSLHKLKYLAAGATLSMMPSAQAQSSSASPISVKSSVKLPTQKSIDKPISFYTMTIPLGEYFNGNVHNLHEQTKGKEAFFDSNYGTNGCIIIYQFSISDEIAFNSAFNNSMDVYGNRPNFIDYNKALHTFSQMTHKDVKNLADAEPILNELRKTHTEGKRSERRKANLLLSHPVTKSIQAGIQLKNDLQKFNQNALSVDIINHEQTHAENQNILKNIRSGQYSLTPEQILKCQIADELAACLSEKPKQENNTSKTIHRFNNELWKIYEKYYNNDSYQQLTEMSSYKIIYAKSLVKQVNSGNIIYSTQKMDNSFDEVLKSIFRKFDDKTQNSACDFIKSHSIDYHYKLSNEEIKSLREDELPIEYHQKALKNRFSTLKNTSHYGELTPYTYIPGKGIQKEKEISFNHALKTQRDYSK